MARDHLPGGDIKEERGGGREGEKRKAASSGRVMRYTATCPTTIGGMQSGSPVGICYTSHTRFGTFGNNSHAQSALNKQNFCIGAQSEVHQRSVVGWVVVHTSVVKRRRAKVPFSDIKPLDLTTYRVLFSPARCRFFVQYLCKKKKFRFVVVCKNGSSVGICTQCLHIFARLPSIYMLSRCSTTKNSASELRRKII